MKSEIKTEVPRVEYPKLMISDNGTVVLFSDYREGIVVHARDQSTVGHYDEDWSNDAFGDFNGKIILSNN